MSVTVSVFGNEKGRDIHLYTLENVSGSQARIMNVGATLVGLTMPDRVGQFGDVTLGFDSFIDYRTRNEGYLGVIAGRVANRIGGARFELDGVEHRLAANNGEHALHGGLRGFDKVFWEAAIVGGSADTAVQFSYTSEDGEEGYPGNLNVSVTYELSDANELSIRYAATTDKATPVNLTNHAYFNLSAGKNRHIADHLLEIRATRYTPVDQALIPTGELVSVTGTPLDFTTARAIGDRINDVPGGYDHNFVLDHDGDYDVRVLDPLSGRVMTMKTSEPGVQFYSGNFLDNVQGRDGAIYDKHSGFCLEAQHFPDSPNKPQFPSIILRPGESYHQETRYAFSVQA